MSFQTGPISAPIQIAGQILNGHIAALCIGGIGVAAAIVMAFFDTWVASLILVAALPVLVVALILVRRRVRNRAWVEVYAEGFCFRDRGGEIAYTDEEVVGVHVSTKNNYRQGELKSHTNTIEFKVADRKDPLSMVHHVKVGQFDPLQGLLQRTVHNYRERAEMALDAGARLSGLGWSMGRDDLDIQATDTTRVAIRDLIAFDTVDEHHKIWRTDVDDAILSVPVQSENAFLLSLLLAPRIAERQQEEVDMSRPGLGRLIFRRQTGCWGKAFGKLFLLLSIVAIPCTVACFLSQNPALFVLGFVLLGLFPITFVIALFVLRSDFRCHERGVYRRMLGKPRELRYEDVEQFTYSAVRQYYNGAYTGTALSLKFEPSADSGKKNVRYSRMVQNVDSAVESLREHVSQIVMPKLGHKLSQTGVVQWMPHVRLSHEGIYYRPKGLVSRKKEEQLLPLEEMQSFSVDDGKLHIWQRGTDKPVISEETNQPNFFPGYLLFTGLYWHAANQQNDDSELG